MSYQRIVLGVAGGIAAYKSADLVRRLKERGCEVRVVLTQGGKAFVNELTFQAVSGEPVYTDLLDPRSEAAMGHIELARWADCILIAPATANEMAKLAVGMANDLLSTLCLATQAPIVLAPAMNRVMWANPATQANLSVLISRGVAVLGPAEGEQACGEVGAGRMLEPLQIVDALLGEYSADWVGKTVVVTAGPTREPIDPVRFVTNRSSGKMGYAVARRFAELGARVVLVSGPTTLSAPAGVERIQVETAAQMMQAVEQCVDQADVFVATAAVADYRLATVNDQKLKKQAETLSLEFVKNPDILASVAERYPQVFTVGFAAETQNVEAYAKEKLDKKRLNMIAANNVSIAGQGFDADQNQLDVYWPNGSKALGTQSKDRLASALVDVITEQFHASAEN